MCKRINYATKETEIIECFLCNPCGPVSIGPRTGGWGPLLYKTKIATVGRIIYKKYISFFSNDINLSISEYFARNKK